MKNITSLKIAAKKFTLRNMLQLYQLCRDADPSDDESDITKPYCSAQVSSFPKEHVF